LAIITGSGKAKIGTDLCGSGWFESLGCLYDGRSIE